MRVSGQFAGDPTETMCGSQLVKAGERSYTAGSGARRWGDYLGAALDPTDTSTVWFVGEYAKNDGFVGWGTFIGATSLSGGCPGVNITLTTDGAVAFGVQALSVTVDTTSGGFNDVQTVSIVKGPADLFIKTTLFADGLGSSWALGTTNGADQVVWEFSTGGTTWLEFTSADTLTSLASGVAQGATADLFLRLTLPTTTSSADEHSATVTIVGTAP